MKIVIAEMLLLGAVLCLAVFAHQEVFAQTAELKKASATIKIRPNVTGRMIKLFRKKRQHGGYSQYTYNLDRFRFAEVNYNPQSQEWRLVGEASDSSTGKIVTMWIRYYEWNNLLQISMTREENIMWKIPQIDSIKVTIPEDKSSFRLDFLKNIEGIHPAGSHHHWMNTSWLLAPR